MFQKENAFNSSEIASLNRILARDSQYSATCSLGPEEESLVVNALISDPVSESFTRAAAVRAGTAGASSQTLDSSLTYVRIYRPNIVIWENLINKKNMVFYPLSERFEIWV